MKNPRNAGRKPKYGVSTRKTSVNVPQPLDDRLTAEAVRRGVGRSDIIVQVLDDALPGGAVTGDADAFE